MKIEELIINLIEIKNLHGNIDVFADSELCIREISTQRYDGEYDVVKYYKKLNGYWEVANLKIKDEDLPNIDLKYKVEKILKL